MKSSLCLCLGTNLCKSPKSPPVIFHNRPNVPVNVPAAEQNCNYILSSTRANISSTVNCISLIVNCILLPTRGNMSYSNTVFLQLSIIFCRQQGKIFLQLSTVFLRLSIIFCQQPGQIFLQLSTWRISFVTVKVGRNEKKVCCENEKNLPIV